MLRLSEPASARARKFDIATRVASSDCGSALISDKQTDQRNDDTGDNGALRAKSPNPLQRRDTCLTLSAASVDRNKICHCHQCDGARQSATLVTLLFTFESQ